MTDWDPFLILAGYGLGTAWAMAAGKGPTTVTGEGVVTPPPATTKDVTAVALPTTTAEEDRHSGSQRRVNLIWEFTQAFIAISLTGAYIYSTLQQVDSAALNNSFFLVVGFYFGRTNHQRVGGVEGGR